jgi:iron complex transport system ATP-binding protein
VIAQTPQLYLLDEPTNHLDMRHQAHVLSHFRQAAKAEGVTVLMALHDINLAQQYCDAVLMLFPDGSSLQGSVSELLTPTHLSKLYDCKIATSNEGDVYWRSIVGMSPLSGV